MIAASERSSGDAGLSRPREAWTIDIESSTVTACGPPARMSSSVRPRHGRTMLSLATSRHVRLSFVQICTLRSSLRKAAKVASGSHIAAARLPPRPIKPLASPSRNRRHRLDRIVAVRARAGNSEGLVEAREKGFGRDLGDADGAIALDVAVARNGQMPAPSLPICRAGASDWRAAGRFRCRGDAASDPCRSRR